MPPHVSGDELIQKKKRIADEEKQCKEEHEAKCLQKEKEKAEKAQECTSQRERVETISYSGALRPDSRKCHKFQPDYKCYISGHIYKTV